MEKSNTNKARVHERGDQKDVFLADDIWPRILAKLPVSKIMSCRSVCKNWNKSTRGNYFIDLQLRETNRGPPCLLLQHNNHLLLVDAQKNAVKRIDFAIEHRLKDYMLKCSCDGLLCMEECSDSRSVFIINPLTGEHIKLPESSYVNIIMCTSHNYGFGFDRSSGRYKVVRACRTFHDKYFSFEILTLGDSSWRRLSTPLNEALLQDGKTWNGFIFWMIYNDNIKKYSLLAFDSSNEKFFTVFPSGTHSLDSRCELVVLGESLAIVKLDDQGTRIWKVVKNRVEGFSLYEEDNVPPARTGSKTLCRTDHAYPVLQLDPDHWVVHVQARSYGNSWFELFETKTGNSTDEHFNKLFGFDHCLQFRSSLVPPFCLHYNRSS